MANFNSLTLSEKRQNPFFELGFQIKKEMKKQGFKTYGALDNFIRIHWDALKSKDKNRLKITDVIWVNPGFTNSEIPERIDVERSSKTYMKLRYKDRFTGESILEENIEEHSVKNNDVLPKIYAGLFTA